MVSQLHLPNATSQQDNKQKDAYERLRIHMYFYLTITQISRRKYLVREVWGCLRILLHSNLVHGSQETKVIVENVNASIPMSLSWFFLPFLAFLCLLATAQFIDSSLYWPNSVFCKSEAALVCGCIRPVQT